MAGFCFGLEKIGYFCLKRPYTVLLLLLIVSAGIFSGMLNLTFADDVGQLFNNGDRVSQATDRYHKAFSGSGGELVLLVESKKPFDREQLDSLRNVHLDIQFVENVIGVSSIFSARNPPDADGISTTLIPAKLPDNSKIPALLENLYQHPLIGNLLLSDDFTSTIMIISLKSDQNATLAKTTAMLNAIAAITDPLARSHGLVITQTGEKALRHDILVTLNEDLHKLNAIGAILAITICMFFFRRPSLVFIASLPPVVAVGWMLGAFGLSGRPVTAMNNVLPTLILVIAFCDSLHMVQTIRRRIGEANPVKDAVAVAIKKVGPACAMTSLTTVVAFLSLNLSVSGAVRDFGNAGAASVFFAFLAVITLVPALSVVLLKDGDNHPAVISGRFNRMLERLSKIFANIAHKAPHMVSIIAIILFMVSAITYFAIDTTYDYRSYLSVSSPANMAIDRIDKKFGGADSFLVLVEDVADKKGSAPASLIAVHRMLEKSPDVRGVFSYVTALDWLSGTTANMADIPAKLPERYRRRMFSSDGKSWRVTAYMPHKPAASSRPYFDRIDAELQKIRDKYPKARIEFAGIIAQSAYSSPTVINGLKLSLALAVITTIIMVGIFVGSIRLALLSAIPNLLPLTLVSLGLYMTGDSISLTTVLALTIAYGIAIDNTIHVLNRYHIEYKAANVEAAIIRSLAKTGPVLIAATILLSSGLAVTQFSQLPTIQTFGLTTLTVLIFALISAMLVLPALIITVVKK